MTRGHYSHLDKYDPGKNDVTGDSLRSKPPSDSFRENFERIFGVAKSGPNHLGKQNDGITDCSKGSADVCGNSPAPDACNPSASRSDA